MTATSPSASSIAVEHVVARARCPRPRRSACTCSGREAPMIAEASSSRRRTQASASWAIVRPALVGDRPQPLHRLEHLVVACSGPSPSPSRSLAARESAGGASPGLYLPVSTPWASGDQTICEIPCSAQSGKTSASGARQIMLYCGWEETNFAAPAHLEAGLDLLRRPLAEADVADLARLDRLGQRLHRLLDRRRRGRSGGTGRGRRSRSAAASARRRAACGSARARARGRSRDIGKKTLVAST